LQQDVALTAPAAASASAAATTTANTFKMFFNKTFSYFNCFSLTAAVRLPCVLVCVSWQPD